MTAVAGKTPEPPPRPRNLSVPSTTEPLRQTRPLRGLDARPQRRQTLVQGEAWPGRG